MIKRLLSLGAALVLSLSLAGCAKKENAVTRLMLDWTPNTNHTGFYVALEKGYYSEAGLQVEIMQPPEDGALALLGSGGAQFAVDFQESLGPAISSSAPLPVVAVASLVSHNTSGIISLTESGIQSPKDLEGKVFSAWETPLVTEIMRQVVMADGGDISAVEMRSDGVTDVISALSTNVDAIWVYYGWDGVAAELAGLDINYFDFAGLDPVFDFYTPLLATNTDFAAENPDTVKAFLEATEKGYRFAIENPDEAAEILLEYAPELDSALVKASQRWLSAQYIGDAPYWGAIDEARWSGFYNWMYEKELLENPLGSSGFTNEYLPAYAGEAQ